MKDQLPASLDDWLLVARVAETTSLVGAAQRLGVSHATAYRRLAALEQSLGVRLFDRRAGRYAPTAASEAMAKAKAERASLRCGTPFMRSRRRHGASSVRRWTSSPGSRWTIRQRAARP